MLGNPLLSHVGTESINKAKFYGLALRTQNQQELPQIHDNSDCTLYAPGQWL